jgi:hypothetical protein
MFFFINLWVSAELSCCVYFFTYSQIEHGHNHELNEPVFVDQEAALNATGESISQQRMGTIH